MKKILMLSMANIRKTKGHTVSLFIMFLITAILLNAGLLVSLNFGSYFKNIAEELNTSNVYYIMSKNLYNDEIDNYLNNHPNISRIQKEDNIWVFATVPYKDNKREIHFMLNNKDENRELSKWKLVGESLPTDSMSVYIPYIMNIDGGYKLNDKLDMTIKDKKISLTVKGFTEDILFSSLDTGTLSLYLPSESYQNVKNLLGDEYDGITIFANLKENTKEIESEIRELTKQESVSFVDSTDSMFSLDLPLVKLSRTMMATIVSIMMVAFSIIIAIVCLIVVRFRISNSIEEDMTKIGSLKALGYTSRQINLSVVLQFVLITIIGSIVGIMLSYLSTPLISNVFAHQSGLMWVQGFDAVISSICLLSILFIVTAVSYISARRINKLNPIVALRGGIVTHSFRKNHMPLHKSKGSLPLVLGLKSSFQNLKQSFMIVVILIAVSFASTFSFVMFYNTVVDRTAFAEIPGIEISNAIAVLNPTISNKEEILQEISKMDEVRKQQYLDETMIKIDNNDVLTYVMKDYTTKETITIYEGRYPNHSNEIAIAGHLAEIIKKDIGDIVKLRFGDKQADFLITGLTQGSSMGGMNASITLDGLYNINPEFKQQTLQIYLKDGVISGEFLKELNRRFEKHLASTYDMDKEIEEGMSIYTDVVSKVGITMMVVTILIVILVLYFVINSSIIRRKRELGIQKAIGFTTLQLMNQLSIGFLFPIIIGVAIGSFIGITQTNPIMSVAQRSMGIMRANYIVSPVWIALFGVVIVLISYLTSMIITYRIRKISAYALVSE